MRDLTAQKFIDRDRVEIGLKVEPLAEPDGVLAWLDVSIRFAAGNTVDFPMLCAFTFNGDGLIERMEEYFNASFFAWTTGPEGA